MENMDPHLEILLQDFVRLYPENTAPGQDHGAAINEIARFVNKERIDCMGSDIRDHLFQQGYTPSKATFLGDQYDRVLQALQRHDRRSQAPAQPLGERGGHRKDIVR